MYQEQEIGSSQELSEWLQLRRRERCPAEGEAKYRSVHCSHPQVFTFLRHREDGAAIVAVNLTGEKVHCWLSWARTLSRRLRVCVDAFNSEPIRASADSAEVEILPYRLVVLLLKPRGWKALPKSERAEEGTSLPAAGRWQVLQDGTVRVLSKQISGLWKRRRADWKTPFGITAYV